MMPELVHEQDLVVLNPTRELIHARISTSHPHPHHVQRLKDAVTHCPTHITFSVGAHFGVITLYGTT